MAFGVAVKPIPPADAKPRVRCNKNAAVDAATLLTTQPSGRPRALSPSTASTTRRACCAVAFANGRRAIARVYSTPCAGA
jgi:hypothetical protein